MKIREARDFEKRNLSGEEEEAEEEVRNDLSNTFCRSLDLSDLQLDTFDDTDKAEVGWRKNGAVRRFISELSSLQHFAVHDINEDRNEHTLVKYFVLARRILMTDFKLLMSFFNSLLSRTLYSQKYGISFLLSDSNLESQIWEIPPSDSVNENLECAYSFRYPVLNNRVDPEGSNTDFDRWSIRQMAIYQQYDSSRDRLMLLLVTPSKAARRNLENLICAKNSARMQLHASALHQTLISTLHGNWRLYIRDLEKDLQIQSDRVTLSTSNLQTDLMLPFLDRQRLNKTEDKILELRIIFDCLDHTISQLTRHCQMACLGTLCKDCNCQTVIYELDEQMHDLKMNAMRIELLHKRAQSASQLMSDVLAYENAQVMNINARSLHELTQESKEENSKMRMLTERSTRDAAAVKILTVITLIYLPVTVVASIFSSQLIHVNDEGRISVIAESWWFVVISLPLTILTFLLWRYWLSHTMRKSELERRGIASNQSQLSQNDEENSFSLIREGKTSGLGRRLNVFRKHKTDVALQHLP